MLYSVYDLLSGPYIDLLDCPTIDLYTVLITKKGKVSEHHPCKIGYCKIKLPKVAKQK